MPRNHQQKEAFVLEQYLCSSQALATVHQLMDAVRAK